MPAPRPFGAALRGLILVLSVVLLPAVASAEAAKTLFGAARAPSAAAPEPIGGHAAGCLAGGRELPETGPGWQAMRLGRNRNWGHPEAIAFVERLSAAARAAGWPGIYVGDISQPRGGPMLSGHSSHQIGLDVDIWLRRPGERPLTRAERESVSSHRVVAANRRDVNGHWSKGHHALIRAAASDPAVSRIFVNAAIKRALCEAEPEGDRAWLRQVRAWWGHDAHFHVRLACPAGTGGCVDQPPPPPGDGCGDELAWWFTEEALSPARGGPARADLTLADLPAACAGVLE